MKKIIKIFLLANMLVISYDAFCIDIKPMCSQQKMEEILEPATSRNRSVLVDCSVELSSKDTITKQLLFDGESASNVQFDCHHATIDRYQGSTNADYSVSHFAIWIRSKKKNHQWSVPHHITIKNCEIKGEIRIQGDINYEDHYLQGYVSKVRAAAPHHITLDHLRIESTGTSHLYLHSGVHHTKIEHSKFSGKSRSATIYLDAETYKNEILYSQFNSVPEKREVIAVDGSEQNTIAYNYFSGINFGGIWLYRNCGERGNVRWTTPSYNQIHHNKFYYKKYHGSNAAIYISSRNDHTRKGRYGYCALDDHYEISKTSSSADASERRDNAVGNRVYRNQFLNRDPDDYIRHGSHLDKTRNQVYQNLRVSKFIKWNETKPEKVVTGGCKEFGNNQGCETRLNCPRGYAAVAGKAACNLEYPNKNFNLGEWGFMEVVRQSDRTSDGVCRLGNTTLRSGRAEIHVDFTRSIIASCEEYDRNGGDCQIKAEILCLPDR